MCPEYTLVAQDSITVCSMMNADVFKLPFFNEGVTNVKNRDINGKKYQLTEIKNLMRTELLDVTGFILHTSHCGSTLLGRMLQRSVSFRIDFDPYINLTQI